MLVNFIFLAIVHLMSILLPVSILVSSWRLASLNQNVPRARSVIRTIQARDLILAVLLLEVLLLPCVYLIGQILFAAAIWNDVFRMVTSHFCDAKIIESCHDEDDCDVDQASVDRYRAKRKKRRRNCGK